jgi:hypothetical protein
MSAAPCAHTAGNPDPADVSRLANQALGIVRALACDDRPGVDAIIAGAPCAECLILSLGILVINAIGGEIRAFLWATVMQAAADDLTAQATQ